MVQRDIGVAADWAHHDRRRSRSRRRRRRELRPDDDDDESVELDDEEECVWDWLTLDRLFGVTLNSVSVPAPVVSFCETATDMLFAMVPCG
jgi:uncharacterized membrane protein